MLGFVWKLHLLYLYHETLSCMLPKFCIICKIFLRYGTADGGETIAAEPEVHNMMLKLAAELNLMPHIVGDKVLAMCADVEVHKCDDNNIVLGTASAGLHLGTKTFKTGQEFSRLSIQHHVQKCTLFCVTI